MKMEQIKEVMTPEAALRVKFGMIAGLGLASLSFVLGIGMVAAEKTNEYFSKNYLQEHKIIELNRGYKNVGLTFSMPITIEKRVPLAVLSPVVATKMNVIDTKDGEAVHKELTLEAKKQIVKNTKYPFIISGIWMNETTQGKGRNDNDPTNHQSNCAKAGLSNEFGYDPQHNTCFESFEESVAFLDKYIDEHLKTLSVNQTLCVYNLGKATDTCAYVQNFRSLDQSGKLALK